MATLRNKQKLAALNKEKCEKHPRSNLSKNSNVPQSQVNYILQVSEELEGRVTKKTSQEFSRTENLVLGTLARLYDFLMNPLIRKHTSKPTDVLTDKKSVTRFFQTKTIPPSLWNACANVLQFNFKIAQIAGSVNTAADVLSRLELRAQRRSISFSGRLYKQHQSR